MTRGSHAWAISISLAILALSLPIPANAASPVLSTIQPRGAQRGTEAVFTLSGSRLTDAQGVYFYEPGLEVVKVAAVNDGNVQLTVKIAPDARIGEHRLRVRTASGISELRTFYIGNLPSLAEVEPNSDFAKPQVVPLGVTVTGIVQSEDVDYYQVDLKKGQRLAVEVEGMRLGTTVFDPYVAILDSKRFELSASDDTPLVKQDAIASIVAPADGPYFVQIRESAYGGNGACQYRLHIGSFPRPLSVYPAGGKIGEEIDVKFLGDAAGELAQKIKLPAVAANNFGLYATDAGGVAPSANPFRLFAHGNVLEAEPNNEIAQATSAQLPLAFNGIIQQPGDVDYFKFAAKKGQTFEINCYARRIRSAPDPVMSLHRADGAQLAANDDSAGPDSYFRFSIPADGDYLIKITDHLGRGGANFVYRVEFTEVAASLSMSIPLVDRYSQERQHIVVARGNRFATLMSVSRTNFGGPVNMTCADLPQGVTMNAEPMADNMTVTPILFEAAADAPIGGKLVNLVGKHADPMQNISGGFAQNIDLTIGSPGQSIYWSHQVNQLAVAVVEELPFKLDIVEPKVPLVQNGSMQVKIVVTRKPDFKGPINVIMPFLPPGVSAASSVQIPADKNEILYPLNAGGGAQIRKWKIYVLGSSDVKGPAWVASQLANLEIAAPYVSFAIERAACETGQVAQFLCKLTINKPFEGNAKVQLVNLPTKVTVDALEFNKDTKELIFKAVTVNETPVGKHKNIFCSVVITENGEPIALSTGSTELQIDKPLPPPANAPPPPPMPKPTPTPVAQPAQPVAKPLSRLEKLRLEAAGKKPEEKK